MVESYPIENPEVTTIDQLLVRIGQLNARSFGGSDEFWQHKGGLVLKRYLMGVCGWGTKITVDDFSSLLVSMSALPKETVSPLAGQFGGRFIEYGPGRCTGNLDFIEGTTSLGEPMYSIKKLGGNGRLLPSDFKSQ